MIRGPPSADTLLVVPGPAILTVVGAEVVARTLVVEVVDRAFVVVDAREGRLESPLLLHAPSVTSATTVTRKDSRGRRTQRS